MQTMINEQSESKTDLSRGFILDGWEVLPLAGSLRKDSHQRHLEPKVMDVLVCLARHQGEVVTRDVLLQEVWGKVIVTDDAINRCISELRTVLGDTERQRNYIRTFPRRGYSLIFPIEPLFPLEQVESARAQDPDSIESAKKNSIVSIGSSLRNFFNIAHPGLSRTLIVIVGPLLIMLIANSVEGVRENNIANTSDSDISNIQSMAEKAIDRKINLSMRPLESIESVAVLPFVNLSGDPAHEYFSDGLSEDIRNALLSITNLRVAARTSSTVFKNKPMDVRTIAMQLNVDALLEGTMRIDDERLRITVQLTDGLNGYSIWAASYERSIDEKIKIQTEIADEIAAQLAPSLKNSTALLKGVTTNVQAHDYYLLGRHHWHERTMDSLQLAEQYFKQALNLDQDYALAYSGLADALMFQTMYGNRKMEDIRDEAYAAILKAMELEPDLAEAHASHGMFLKLTSGQEAARTAFRRAVELKPHYSMAHMWLGTSWSDSKNVKQAHKHFQDAIKVDPLHPQVQANYANSLMNQGFYDETLKVLAEFSKVNPSEKFLKIQLEARLAMGQYDEVLNLAVGHTFTGEYKPYTNMAVIEALIQLQHIDKARRIVRDNVGVMDDWLISYANASIAVVDRDFGALKEVVKRMRSDDFEVEHQKLAVCIDSFSSYLDALATYIGGEYEKANKAFDVFNQKLANSECMMTEPELEIAAQLYHAMSKVAVNVNDVEAKEILSRARKSLDELKALGWNTPTLTSLDVALHHMMNDDLTALKLVWQMVERGWQPFGTMVSSPLFDSFLSAENVSLQLAGLNQDYQEMRAQSDHIGLAKLGL
ncbi:MAG: hypothetical protein GKR90_27575 [Pseudomonadales bacterium]|nr:hypothetical protein [Pseudomonadales bacterium]